MKWVVDLAAVVEWVEVVEGVDGKIGKIKLLGFSGGTGIMSAGGHYL